MNPLGKQQANGNGPRPARRHFANMQTGATGNCTNNIWKAGQRTTSPSEQRRRAWDSRSLETEKNGATGQPSGRRRKTTVTKEHHRDTMEIF